MTTDREAEIVLKIMLGAGDSCSHCAGELFRGFIQHFPQFKQLARNVWSIEFAIGDLDE